MGRDRFPRILDRIYKINRIQNIHTPKSPLKRGLEHTPQSPLKRGLEHTPKSPLKRGLKHTPESPLKRGLGRSLTVAVQF